MSLYYEYGERELAHLRKKDKKLGIIIDRVGMIKREVNPDLFQSLVKSVVSQQISAKAAGSIYGRLNEMSGMEAIRLHNASLEDLHCCGMSLRKAGYIKNVAEAVVNKTIDFDTLAEKSDREIIQILTTLRGVGVWTAEMLLIFSLMRPNVVSYGDLAIRRGMMRLYGLKDLTRERFQRYAKRYAPYGSVASLYLWHISVPEFVM